jgi:CBS domain-containing protein
MKRVRYVIEAGGAIEEQAIGSTASMSTMVGSIMTPAPVCVRADVRINDVTDLLLERGFSAMPVVDADGRAMGIVSKTDLLRHARERGARDAMVERVMMPIVFAVEETASMGDAAALMAGEGVHRLPVIDLEGRVVGVLSALDLVRWLGQLAGYQL